MELRRSRRCCSGAQPDLQWNFVRAVGVVVELGGSCNRVSPEHRCCIGAPSGYSGAHRGYNGARWGYNRARQTLSVLHWSTTRGCNGAALKLWCFVAAVALG